MTPIVSILIPVYNRVNFIAECIQSALDQNFSDFEVVVVDNMSNDGTWEVCKEFALKDTRVKIYRNEKNVGPVLNWKRCVEYANGYYSKILFSDDLLEPNCLAKMVHNLQDSSVGFVYSVVRIGQTRRKSVLAFTEGPGCKLTSKEFIKLAVRHRAPGSPCAVLFRTQDFSEFFQINIPTKVYQPFEKHGAGPDIITLFKIAEQYRFVVRINEPLVFFRVHGDSLTVSNQNNMIVNGYTSAISHYLKNNCTSHEWLLYLSDSWLRLVKKNREWNSVKDFLYNNEGSGNLIECTTFCLYSIFVGIKRILLNIRF